MTDLGTHVQHDDRPAVRFERTYPHPRERVWRAVTDPAELPAWFPSQVEYEPRVGAPIRFTGDPYAADTAGTVLAWDPPHRFAFTWGDGEVHLTLEDVDGGCRLVLVDVLDDPESAAQHAAGWHMCLDQVPPLLEGAATPGPHAETATAFRPLYDRYVAAGLPHGASLPID